MDRLVTFLRDELNLPKKSRNYNRQHLETNYIKVYLSHIREASQIESNNSTRWRSLVDNQFATHCDRVVRYHIMCP